MSPALADWSAAAEEAEDRGFDLPPTLILAGTRELLLADAAQLARAMRKGGVDVGLSVYDGMWHSFQGGIPGPLGLPEAIEAIEEVVEFVLKLVPPPKAATS